MTKRQIKKIEKKLKTRDFGSITFREREYLQNHQSVLKQICIRFYYLGNNSVYSTQEVVNYNSPSSVGIFVNNKWHMLNKSQWVDIPIQQMVNFNINTLKIKKLSVKKLLNSWTGKEMAVSMGYENVKIS